jgi:hypothetical protein
MTLQNAIPPVGLAAVSALLIQSQAMPVWKCLRTRFWQPTTARVLSCDAVPLRIPMMRPPLLAITAHTLAVRYTYTVGQHTYVSTRFSFHGYRPDSASIAKLSLSYPTGASVAAWYDPSHPDEAVLQRGPGLLNVVVLYFGLCALLGAILLLPAWVAT